MMEQISLTAGLRNGKVIATPKRRIHPCRPTHPLSRRTVLQAALAAGARRSVGNARPSRTEGRRPPRLAEALRHEEVDQPLGLPLSRSG